jgi:hypothetical protein
MIPVHIGQDLKHERKASLLSVGILISEKTSCISTHMTDVLAVGPTTGTGDCVLTNR